MSRRWSVRNRSHNKSESNTWLKGRRFAQPRFEALEDRTMPVVTTMFAAGVLTFTSDGAGDLVYLQSTGTPSTVQYNGGGLGLTTQAGVTQVIYNGNGGADELVLAQAGGNIFAPAAGINFNGGGNVGDQLSLGGGGAAWTGIYNVGGPTSGNISYTNGVNTATVNFTGTLKLRDSTTGASLTTNTTAGFDHITITTGPVLPDLPTFSQGPAVIDGGDREEHGSFSGGVNINGWKYIEQCLNFINTNVFNGAANDILAVGVTGSSALAALTSTSGALGLGVTIVTGAAISTVNFDLYKILYVPSDAGDVGGGISQANHDLLAARTNDIRNFSNDGGGIFALTEAVTVNAYGWLQIPDPFTITSFGAGGISDPLRKTPAAIAAGLTITDPELSAGVPYHNVFTGPPGFNGLDPFVLDDGPNNIVGDADDRIVALGNAAINSTPIGGGGLALDVQFPAGGSLRTPLCVNHKANLIFNTLSAGDRVDITGTVLNNGGASPTLPVRINVNTLGGNDGYDIHNLSQLNITNSTVTGKGVDGVNMTSVGAATITNSTFNGNTDDGIDATSGGSLTLNGVTANGNGEHGFFGMTLSGVVNVSNSSFSNNTTGNGFFIDSFFDVFISVSTFNNNGANGFCANNGRNGALTNVTANNNPLDGALATNMNAFTINGGAYNGNADDGFDADDVNTVSVGSSTGAQFNNNGDHGIELFGGAGLDDLFRTATILRSQMINNTNAGIYVDGDTNPADCTGDTVVLIGTAVGNGNRIEDNNVGIDVWGGCVIAMFNDIGIFGGGVGNVIGARLSDVDGFLQLECNQIRGNGTGVVNAAGGGTTVQALFNWWGGGAPNTPGNDTTIGSVDFGPWAINSDCTGVPPPTITSEGDLLAVGTAGPDSIVVTVVGPNVEVKVNGIPKVVFLLTDITGHLIVFGFAGNDSITVVGPLPSEIHGGNGRDVITGGERKDIIWGDAGDDFIQGELGNDVLIGGTGKDRLSAGSGMDILLGGDFCKGNRHNGVEAFDYDVLCQISKDWAMFGIADADLDSGLIDDVMDTEADRLTGGLNNPNVPGGGPIGDWFLGNFFGPGIIDVITDFLAPDKRTDL